MTKKISLLKFQIISFIISCILGVLFHFTYEFSDNNTFVAIFSSINESTWEHLKLIFFPMILTTLFGYLYFGKKYPNFLCARTIAILCAMIFTVVFFYTYTGILGRNIAFIDISSFFISILIGEYITSKLINFGLKCNKTVSFIILFGLLILFILFTFNPPGIQLFQDPITGNFGVTKNSIE